MGELSRAVDDFVGLDPDGFDRSRVAGHSPKSIGKHGSVVPRDGKAHRLDSLSQGNDLRGGASDPNSIPALLQIEEASGRLIRDDAFSLDPMPRLSESEGVADRSRGTREGVGDRGLDDLDVRPGRHDQAKADKLPFLVEVANAYAAKSDRRVDQLLRIEGGELLQKNAHRPATQIKAEDQFLMKIDVG